MYFLSFALCVLLHPPPHNAIASDSLSSSTGKLKLLTSATGTLPKTEDNRRVADLREAIQNTIDIASSVRRGLGGSVLPPITSNSSAFTMSTTFSTSSHSLYTFQFTRTFIMDNNEVILPFEGSSSKVSASTLPSQPLSYSKLGDDFKPMPISEKHSKGMMTIFYLAVTAPHTDKYEVHGRSSLQSSISPLPALDPYQTSTCVRLLTG
jgi:hypothetical protein